MLCPNGTVKPFLVSLVEPVAYLKSELIAKYQSQNAFLIAEVYSFQKEPDQAFKWLDRAYVQHDSTVPETKASTLLKNLRGDPRYTAFLKKLRLPL